MIVVADASPLIALSRVGRLELLRQLFGRLSVPEAVWREVALTDPYRAGVTELLRADWVERRQVVDVALVQLLRRDLGAGGSEAIVLLIDERLGRSAAARLGLPLTGLVGVLIEARRQGLLPDAALVIEQLRHGGFWISDHLAALVEGA